MTNPDFAVELQLRKFLQTTHYMQEVQIIAKLESR